MPTPQQPQPERQLDAPKAGPDGQPAAAPAAACPGPADGHGDLPDLLRLEAEARRRGWLLRLRVQRPLGVLWSLRVAVARPPVANPGGAAGLELLGDLKGWAWPGREGLHLDTMRVQADQSAGVGWLLWAATFAWSLEATPCRRARLLAIRDGERQHRRLVRYFRSLGFEPDRELGAALGDLAPRLLWGGAGLLMQGDCREGLRRSSRRLGLAAGPAA